MASGILGNSLLNALAGLTLLVTGFASTIITARILGPEANGIIAFSLWLVVSGASIAELGSSVMLLKMMPELKAQGFSAERRRGFAAVMLTQTLIATLVLTTLYGLAFLTTESLHWAKTAPSVAVVTAVLFVIQAIGSFSKFYLIGEKQLGKFFRLSVLVGVLQIGGVAVGALHFGVEGALVGYALGQMVLFIATAPIIFARRDRCDVSQTYLRASSFVITLEFILDSIFLNRVELLFLQQFWSIKVVGFYAVGLSVANMALQIPIQLTGSLLPYYSERRHAEGDAGLSPAVIAGVVRSLAYITLPISFGLAAISEELITLVFGEAFRESWMIVALLALAAPGAAFMQTLSLYMLSIDRVRDRLYISILAAITMVGLCLLLVPMFGGEGAAVARIAVFIVMCVAMIFMLRFGSHFLDLYASLAKVALASAFSGAAAWSSLQYVSGPFGLVAAIALGVIVYLLGIRVFRAVAREDAEVLTLAFSRLPAALHAPLAAMIAFLAPARVSKAI